MGIRFAEHATFSASRFCQDAAAANFSCDSATEGLAIALIRSASALSFAPPVISGAKVCRAAASEMSHSIVPPSPGDDDPGGVVE